MLWYDAAPGESTEAPLNRAAELLADYLLAAGPWAVAGADGMTVAEAVAAFYPPAAAAGRVPSAAELTRRHPELARDFPTLLHAPTR